MSNASKTYDGGTPKVALGILVIYLKKVTVHVAKNNVLCTSSYSMVNIIDLKQVDEERDHMKVMVHTTSEPPVQTSERNNIPIARKGREDTMSLSQ